MALQAEGLQRLGLALRGWCTGTTWSNSQLPSSMGAEQSLQRKFCLSRMRSRLPRASRRLALRRCWKASAAAPARRWPRYSRPSFSIQLWRSSASWGYWVTTQSGRSRTRRRRARQSHRERMVTLGWWSWASSAARTLRRSLIQKWPDSMRPAQGRHVEKGGTVDSFRVPR